MEADLFRLLSSNHLQNAISTKDNVNITNFSRFLAAFFADLPIICPDDANIQEFPSLWRLSGYSEADYDKSKFKKLQPDYVSANIPPTYSPSLPVQLLCLVGNWTEACLYVDHFNDLRSQLILRVLTDIQYGLSLVQQHLHQIFIYDFIETLTYDHISDDYIKLHVEVFTKLSVLFNFNWLYSLLNALSNRFQDVANGFPDDVDSSVMLPRPPVYMLAGQETGEIPELIQWNAMYRLIRTFLYVLQRVNWLKSLSGGLMMKIWKINPNFKARIINEDFEDVDESLQTTFENLIKIVLRFSYRDQIAIWKRRSEDKTELIEISQKYDKIQDDNDFLIHLDSNDIDEIVKTLQLFEDISEEKERYLPPLSSGTVEQWKTALFTEVKVASGRRSSTELQVIGEDQKLEVSQKDFLILDYIANTLPFISLSDSTLIGITLKLKPSDICRMKPRTFYNSIDQSKSSTNIEKEPIERPLEHSLGDRIRASLRRLGGKPLEDKIKENMDKVEDELDHEKMKKQLMEEREYLNSLKQDSEVLEAYKMRIRTSEVPKIREIPSFEKLRMLKMAKSPGLKRRVANDRHDEYKRELSPLQGDLSDELKAISARLTDLKSKWSGTPEQILKYKNITVNGAYDYYKSPIKVKDNIRASRSMVFSKPSTWHNHVEEKAMNKMAFSQYDEMKPSTSKSMVFNDNKSYNRPARSWKDNDLSSGISSSSISPDLSDRKKAYRKRKDLQQGHDKMMERQREEKKAQEPSESDSDSGLRSSRDTQKLSEDKDPKIDLKQQDDVQEPPEYDLNYTNEYYENLPGIPEVPLDQDDYVPEAIAEPMTPGSIGRLDLSLLSDRQAEKSKGTKKPEWTDIKVYDRTPKTFVKPRQPEVLLPDWLKLLPYEPKATSSRLLSLNGEKDSKSKSSRTGRKSKSPFLNIKDVIRDSGYLDAETSRSLKKQPPVAQQPEQTVIHDETNVFDMTEEQINSLLMNS